MGMMVRDEAGRRAMRAACFNATVFIIAFLAGRIMG